MNEHRLIAILPYSCRTSGKHCKVLFVAKFESTNALRFYFSRKAPK